MAFLCTLVKGKTIPRDREKNRGKMRVRFLHKMVRSLQRGAVGEQVCWLCHKKRGERGRAERKDTSKIRTRMMLF